MPITYEMKKNARLLVTEAVNDVLNTQREMEDNFSKLMMSDNEKNPQAIGEATKSLKAATYGLHRTQKQNPLAVDNMEKIESDRVFLELILEKLIHGLEIQDLSSLTSTVGAEKNKKIELESVIKREEHSRKKIKELQKALIDIKQERETEIQQRNELIAHLKDRFQELKAKTNMEAKYVKKSTDNSVLQAKKKCDLSEAELKQQIEKLQEQIDEENRCNGELESYLKNAIAKMKNMTDFWNEKSDRETIEKQTELDKLKTMRAKDLERYQSLLKTFNEYEAVVLEDRGEKDQARKQAEREKYELESSIRIQAWWRGMMMRHKLGTFGKKKKKGKKKGKKK